MTLLLAFQKRIGLCLDVGIGAQTMELESDFLNTDVWMYMELRLGIEDPIPWY